MKSSFQSNSFLAIILQLTIPKTRQDYCRLLCWVASSGCVSLCPLGTGPTENTACIIIETCLPHSCLAVDALLSLVLPCTGMCLPSRCLAMSIHVTIIIPVWVHTHLSQHIESFDSPIEAEYFDILGLNFGVSPWSDKWLTLVYGGTVD
jgi:hypothetical protein